MLIGIQVTDNYRIETYDKNNVVVKKFVPAKQVPQKDGSVKYFEEGWKDISYHPNVKQAIKSIFNRETNLTVSDGIQALMDKMQEFESLVNNL